MDAITILLRWAFFYRVQVLWAGMLVTHWARTEEDARSWLACYPLDSCGSYWLRGRFIGERF